MVRKPHYNDVITSAMVLQITGVSIVWFAQPFGQAEIKKSKLCVTGLCEGNPVVIAEFPSQWASIAENVSIWCFHRRVIETLACGNKIPLDMISRDKTYFVLFVTGFRFQSVRLLVFVQVTWIHFQYPVVYFLLRSLNFLTVALCSISCYIRLRYTVYPKKNAHGFVVLCFVVVM